MAFPWPKLPVRLRALGRYLAGEVLHLRDGSALGAEATRGGFSGEKPRRGKKPGSISMGSSGYYSGYYCGYIPLYFEHYFYGLIWVNKVVYSGYYCGL